MDAHTFEPDRKVTRAMFVTIMGRMYGADASYPAPESFTDVQASDWFAPYVGWAADCGVVNGYDDGTFAPNLEITRYRLYSTVVHDAEAKKTAAPCGKE